MTHENELIDEMIEYVAGELVAGRGPEEIEGELVAGGVPERAAAAIVAAVVAQRRRLLRRAGMKSATVGLGWLALGLVITGATYGAASAGGGYVVMIGLIASGLVQTLAGLGRAAFA